MTAIDQMELAHDEGFKRRVKYFMQKSAVAIMGETSGPRTDYSKLVLDGSASVFEMAVAVLSASNVLTEGDTISDTTLETAITGRWNQFSGITS